MMRANVLAPSTGPPPVPVAVLLQQQRQQGLFGILLIQLNILVIREYP